MSCRGDEKLSDLIVFSNGPGEISTWVLPVIEEIRKNKEISRLHRIILIIHPCQFGSGTEHVVAHGIEGVEHVISPSGYMKFLFTGLGKKRYGFRRNGIILSLGGDLMHPVLFKIRIRGKHRMFAYTNNPGWEKHYEKIFVRNEQVRNKSKRLARHKDRLIVTGDLVYSSLKSCSDRDRIRDTLGLAVHERMLAFLPGSRFFEVAHMLPLFLKVIDDIAKDFKDFRPFILKSPYMSYECISEALAGWRNVSGITGLSGTLVEEGQKNIIAIKIPNGRTVPVLEGGFEQWGEGIDFAVTVPGTNTVQLAYRKVPALVVAPVNRPELIPIEGAAGLLKWVPFGKSILRKAATKYVERFSFSALPNMYANREILPELFGVITTEDVTKKLHRILANSEYLRIRDELSFFTFQMDPSRRIVEEIWGTE
jgi:lipid-A-disaccharide synthase